MYRCPECSQKAEAKDHNGRGLKTLCCWAAVLPEDKIVERKPVVKKPTKPKVKS